jgi:peptidoglycan/xylan/chitin deacetylase (PgdA/CDA1 family)
MLIVLAIVIGVAALSHMVPGPFLLEAFRPSKSVWRIPPRPGDPPTIYLTFDDGPNPDWTPALLDALADVQVDATFFLIDAHITPETAPIVRRIADEGHAIGLHSNTRKPMIQSPAAVAAMLERQAARVVEITGRQPCRLFRPHGGWRSASMYDGLERAGYRLAGWSWGMWDWNWWRDPRADEVVPRLSRKADAGDIVVIHDGHHKDPRADRRQAGETVRRLVPALRARQFTFGTLCSM